MAGSGFTTTLRNKVLKAEFFTADVWGACCDADPTDAGLSTAEISASYAYTRMTLTMADAAAGSTDNTAALEFPAASGGDWGTIAWLGVTSAGVEAAADFIASGPLTTSKLIEDGDQLVFAIGNITISIAAQA